MKKQLVVEFILCFFLGVFGAHRFYTKRWITASIMLLLSLTKWGLIITIFWAILDLIVISIFAISIPPKTHKGSNTKENLISHNDEIPTSTKLNIEDYLLWLRNLNFQEGKQQRKTGTAQQATNCFMKIIYLDLIDDFNSIYNDICLDLDIDIDDNSKFIPTKEQKAKIMQKAHKQFKEKEIFIAPAIYKWAFEEDLSLEEFEKIFKFNAQNFKNSVKYKLPITPDEAWQKILEYRENIERI